MTTASTFTIRFDCETGKAETEGTIDPEHVEAVATALLNSAMMRPDTEAQDWPVVNFENAAVPALTAMFRRAVTLSQETDESGEPEHYVGTEPHEWMQHLLEVAECSVFDVPKWNYLPRNRPTTAG